MATCGAKKLRVTVVADRLELKDLKQRIKSLESRIQKHDGVTVSEPLEKDLPTIMDGQNLESTPHMKFFWEQQMRLCKSKKWPAYIIPQSLGLLCRYTANPHQHTENTERVEPLYF